MIEIKDVEHVAKLARLELTEAEKTPCSPDKAFSTLCAHTTQCIPVIWNVSFLFIRTRSTIRAIRIIVQIYGNLLKYE